MFCLFISLFNLFAWYISPKLETKAALSKVSPECPAQRLDSQQHQAFK